MSPDAVELVEVDLDLEAGELLAGWKDGHASRYPFALLRGECPCASCRTEREERRTNPFRVLPQSAGAGSEVLIDLEPVGRYGVRLAWKDGHDLGIYTFEYLREICPCEECKAARAPQGPYVHGIRIPGGS